MYLYIKTPSNELIFKLHISICETLYESKKDLNYNLVLFNLMIKSNKANLSLGIGLEISIVTLFISLHFLGKKKKKDAYFFFYRIINNGYLKFPSFSLEFST